MGIDEEGTLSRLTVHRRDVFDPSIVRNRGRIVKTTGDGLLAEFASVVDAVRCAVLVAGRYADAVTAERRAVQLRPDFDTAWRTLTAAAGLAGDLELARQGLAECKRLQPNVSIAWIEKYYPLIRVEDRGRYIEGLRRAGLQ